MEKYLPIGTIVLLHEGTKTIMIYGRMQSHMETEAIYDYVACLYPEGNIGNEYTYLFNHDQISEVVHLGYVNDDEAEFLQILEEENQLLEQQNIDNEE